MLADDVPKQAHQATKIIHWHISCLHEGSGEWPNEGWQFISITLTYFCLFTHKFIYSSFDIALRWNPEIQQSDMLIGSLPNAHPFIIRK